MNVGSALRAAWALLAIIAGSANQAAAAPTLCAIRWDAWYTNGPSDPGAFTAAALSVKQWRDRAPLHARFDSEGRISWAASQASFDAEIRAASSARLCWVYLAYGDHGVIDLDHPMMRGLWFHRRSAIRAQVDYALMITPSLLVGGDRKMAEAALLELLADANYLQVAVGSPSRPVLFLYVETSEAKRWTAAAVDLRETLDVLRREAGYRGLGNPYVVVTLGGAESAETLRAAIGAEAISQYVAGRRRGREVWASFEPSIEADWDRYAAATEANVIPTLRTGADIRARCQTPPPFEHRFAKGASCDDYVSNPSLPELEVEFRRARSWVDKNEAKDPSGLLLVYAWSECDESGNCLMPTYGDPEGRKLEAIARAMSP